MSRINLPERFLDQKQLLAKITAKHTADGVSSPLNPYIDQHSIDLAALITAGTTALTHHTDADTHALAAEKHQTQRDGRFKPVFKRYKEAAQYLKAFYNNNLAPLADWGINVNNESKIVYPTDFLELTLSMRPLYDKHIADGEDSHLAPFYNKHGIVATDETAALDAAIVSHNAMTDALLAAEQATANRNTIWNPVMDTIRGIANFLKKLYTNNPKDITDWGINIDDSPRPPKLRTSTVLLSSQKVSKSLVIGSILTNIGNTPLHIYKGMVVEGDPIVVNAGAELGIAQGMSVLTVVNPSALENGKFTVWATS